MRKILLTIFSAAFVFIGPINACPRGGGQE